MKNTKLTWLLGVLIVALLLPACVSEKQKKNTLNFSGAFALYPMVIKWSELYKKEHPNVRFNISAGGAGKGMADAMAGTVDLGMFSREIMQQEKDKGVWWVGLCIDAVLPTISANHPYLEILQQRGLSKAEFQDIFIEGNIKDWGKLLDQDQQAAIQVYSRADACGAAGTWAKYLGAKQEDLKGVGIHGDPALAEAVSKDPTGIAFNNTIFIYDIKTGLKRPGIEVLPIDLNENGKIDPEENFYASFPEILNAIATGNYPSPPARELYFVAKEKPQKQSTLDFIKWILTDGQAYIKEAGYVPIAQEKIDHYLKKLND
jgi:phosphate transport system substrate-binding protein